MNIVVERSSDDDYSSLSSCSSLGELLDEFFNIIYKKTKPRVIYFNSYKILTTVKSRESLEAQIGQMEEEDEYVALARLGNENW